MLGSYSNERNTHYRPDVDGLRAIAVLGVVLFHAGLGFSGGYIGVDVFFVISGYLITGIITREIQAGTFTLQNFWIRRIRRILPAASVTVFATLIAGYLLLTPSELKSLANSTIAQTFLAANFYFWKDVDYFAADADYKPLLHTWSLALEEQFYFFYPLLIFFIFKKGRTFTTKTVVILALLSLTAAFFRIERAPEAAFFLLPTRAWELMAGGIIALTAKRVTGMRTAEILSWGGMALIVIPMFLYSLATPFPGLTAIPPVLGATLLIFANEGHKTSASRFLSSRFFLFIGQISYSLYLWHWPILSLARNIFVELSIPLRMGLVTLSFVMAIASWRFIETPFRRKKKEEKPAAIFMTAFAVTAFIAATAATISFSGGMDWRIPPEFRRAVDNIDWNGSEFAFRQINKPVAIGKNKILASEKIDFVVWGDSHGLMMGEVLSERATANQLHGKAFLRGNFVPVPGTFHAWGNSKTELAEQDKLLQYLISNRVKNLLLICRWAAICDGYTKLEVEENPRRDLNRFAIIDQQAMTPTRETSKKTLARGLKNLAQKLEKSGTTLWILKQVPEVDERHPARDFYLSKRFPQLNVKRDLKRFSFTKEEYLARQENANEVIDSLRASNVKVLDPARHFFEKANRVELWSDRAHYRDEDHLTRFGCQLYLSDLFDSFFKEVMQKSL